MDDLRRELGYMTKGGSVRYHDEGVKESAGHYNQNESAKDRLPIRIRPAVQADAPMVYSDWLRSNAAANKNQAKFEVYDLHRPIVKRCMEEAVTLIACHEDDSDQVFAWVCGVQTPEFLAIHYAFCKQPFRCLGITKTLLNLGFGFNKRQILVHSHKSYLARELRKEKNWRLYYAPFLLQPGGLNDYRKQWRTFNGLPPLEDQ
tara:strand:- start:222 stop:830 length:609 start_codon:yes stop_codon:yes gene_type:complete